MPPGNKDDAVPKTDASNINLRELWARSTRYNWSSRDTQQAQFRILLRKLLSDPAAASDVMFCRNCAQPEWDHDLRTAGNDWKICTPCWDSWTACGHCEKRYATVSLCPLLNGTSYCYPCRNAYCTYCTYCGGPYDPADEDAHDHNCCKSPQRAFAIRHNDSGPLVNDTRTTITLPAGVISDEGLAEISRYLADQRSGDGYQYLYSLAYDLEHLDSRWQTTGGNYTKRLSSYAYKAHGVKLTPEIVSQVGCIARDHSKPVDVAIEATRNLNMRSSDFGNNGSCWWGGYSESRCALKTNGGFALRTFNYGNSNVSGRAWVMPLRQGDGRLSPTFDTTSPAAFVTFNGYGDLNGYTAARVLAYLAGWTYRKISFRCDPMFVNADSGYLVAPEPVISRHASGLHLSVSRHASLFSSETIAAGRNY
jgi:hypothetical protein